MIDSENMRKIVKVFIIAVLCSEMQSILTDQQAAEVLRRTEYADYVAGVEAGSEAKYHVSIRLAAQDGRFGEGHLCSGALIAPAVVLTVAHCLFDYKANTPRHPAQLRVVLGNVNRYRSDPETLVATVTHVYRPKTFDAVTLHDNIAILMLEHDIPASKLRVQPIAWECVNKSQPMSTEQHQRHASPVLRVTSWGASSEGSPVAHLMSLSARRLAQETCHTYYRGFFAKDMHCIRVANENGTLCPQDAGAPLLEHNRLIGLASFTMQGCAANAYPTFYTNISQHRAWILAHIGNGSHQNGSVWGSLAFVLFTAYVIKKSNLVKIEPLRARSR